MAGKEPVEIWGIRLEVEPRYWLRRAARFPLYFEHHNPTFDFIVTRLSDKDIPADQAEAEFPIRLLYGDGRSASRNVTLPLPSGPGQSLRWRGFEPVLSPPGQTSIEVAVDSGRGANTLYTYKVRSEESIWIGSGVLALGLLSIGGNFLVARCTPVPEVPQQPPPVVNVEPPIVNVILPTPVPTATSTTEATVGP